MSSSSQVSFSRRSRRHRIAATLVVLVLLVVAFPGLVSAGTQGGCVAGDDSKVRLWENVIGDTQDNNDSYWKCGDDSDLNNDSHTLPGDCKGTVLNSTTWNDCVSSVSVWVPAGWCVSFYRDAGYNFIMANNTIQGPAVGVRFNLQYNDQLSSFLFYQC